MKILKSMAVLTNGLPELARGLFATTLPRLVISLFFLLFLVIPVSSVFLDVNFWDLFISRLKVTTSIRIAQSLALMAPGVGFSALVAYAVGSVTSAKVLGRRHAPRTITLCFMFALYGTALGFLGSSSKEVAGTELFASITTVATALFGYLISKDLEARLKAMVPAALICFLLSFMFTSHYYASFPSQIKSSNGT